MALDLAWGTADVQFLDHVPNGKFQNFVYQYSLIYLSAYIILIYLFSDSVLQTVIYVLIFI